MAKILIVDDDELFRDALEKNLRGIGFEVSSAENGRLALESMKQTQFDVIVSDIRMPEMDGIELLRAIRSNSQLPVILMTGFADIMETHSAHQLGANEFIAKPFSRSDLEAAVHRCVNAGRRQDDTVTKQPETYCKLGINDFISGRSINFNIFARLSEQKFVKIAHKGEDISADRIRFYREKGLQFLYLRSADFKQYVGFSTALASAARKSDAIGLDKKVNLLRHVGEILNEQIRHDGVNEHIYESAQAFVEATLDIITDNSKAVDALIALRSHADHLLAHSVGVSLYAVMIAQTVDWNLPSNRFKVAMGGLFHDLGLKEVSREQLVRPRYSWTLDEVKKYETHPLRGLTLLNEIEEIPEDVREIIRHHHENCLSRGFPAGVKKAAIHPMAKLISVADEFCYRIIRAPHSTSIAPGSAIQEMKETCSELLDRKFLDALGQLFEATPNPV
ncbi:MAG TPA: response regulator [Pseudobdellovibrionaceae bacterium]|nr:response regulator [Pseudobdellovibrionaceae bacterium]